MRRRRTIVERAGDDPGICSILGTGVGVHFAGPFVPWSPAVLGSAVLAWYRGDTVPTLDGSNNVVSLADRGPHGYTATQATPANRPGYARNGGLGYLDCSSSTLLPIPTIPITAQPIEIFAVVHPTSVDVPGTFPGIFATGAGGLNLYQYDDSSLLVSNAGHSLTTPITVADHIVSAQFNGAASSVTVDNVTTVGDAGTHGIAASPAIAFAFVGRYYELIVINRLLTAPERLQMVSYLETRYRFAPTVASMAPVTGITQGGTPITLTGQHFASASRVEIGGRPCTSVVVVSPTSITCVAPALTASVTPYDVRVISPSGVGTLAAGYTSWDPGNLTSAVFGWFRGDTGVTLDGSGNVSALADKSPNHYDATQATAINRPGYNANGGLGYLDYDGTEKNLVALGSPGHAQPIEIFAAVRPTNLAFPGSGGGGIISDSGGGAQTQFGVATGGSTIVYAGGLLFGPSVTTADHVVNLRLNGGTSVLAVDGADGAPGDAGAQTLGAGLSIGQILPGNVNWTGRIYELIFINRLLTAPERVLMNDYLEARYLLVPVVSSMTPGIGVPSGGVPLTLTGQRFTDATRVEIGGVPCGSFTVVNATSITCTSPNLPASATPYDVVVFSPAGNGTLAGGYTAWDPFSLGSAIFGWYRGDSGISLDGSNNVQTWTDKGSNHYNAAQATAISRPGYNANGGLGYLVNTATTDLVVAGSPARAHPVEVFVVARATSATPATIGVLFDSGLGVKSAIAQVPTVGTVEAATAAGAIITIDQLTAVDHIVSAQFNGVSSNVAIDGNAGVSGDLTDAGSMAATMTLGGYAGGSFIGFDGRIYEILVVNRLLTTPERVLTKAYCKARYSIA